MNTNTNANTTVTTWTLDWHKPEGRGDKFRREARGLARRMRIPWVREVHAEARLPESMRPAQSYGSMWTSDHALTNFSFSCATCHPHERYSRKKKHPGKYRQPR